jgi:hypothetical protein
VPPDACFERQRITQHNVLENKTLQKIAYRLFCPLFLFSYFPYYFYISYVQVCNDVKVYLEGRVEQGVDQEAQPSPCAPLSFLLGQTRDQQPPASACVSE